MNKANKSKLAILKKVRKILECSLYHDHYICNIIRVVKGPVKMKDELCDLFDERIGGHFTYRRWMMVNHPILYYGVAADERPKKLQQGRIAWVDSLIEEFSN